MKVSLEQALNGLREIVGAEHVLTDEQSLKLGDSYNRSYAKAFDLYQTPLPIAIVTVYSTDQVSAVLSYCNENLIHVIPRTGASGGEGLLEVICEDTIILDASNMNQILKIDQDNMMVTCQCGAPLQEVEDQVNRLGLSTVKAHGPDGRAGGYKEHWAVLYLLRGHRRHDLRDGSCDAGWQGDADKECAEAVRRP